MAWCRQASNRSLSQRWSRSLSPYGVTKPQKFNAMDNCFGDTGLDKCSLQHVSTYQSYPILTYQPCDSFLRRIFNLTDLSNWLFSPPRRQRLISWWCNPMATFSALLVMCAGNSPVTGEFPAQRPVTWSIDVFFDLRLNERLSKQSSGWWFETPLHPSWRHSNVYYQRLAKSTLSLWYGSLITCLWKYEIQWPTHMPTSTAWVIIYIPYKCLGCNYLSMPSLIHIEICIGYSWHTWITIENHYFNVCIQIQISLWRLYLIGNFNLAPVCLVGWHRKVPGTYMMTSSNGNIFRVTGLLCGEFTGHRWIPFTKASGAELWCFLSSVAESMAG